MVFEAKIVVFVTFAHVVPTHFMIWIIKPENVCSEGAMLCNRTNMADMVISMLREKHVRIPIPLQYKV
jgi:hypothetical protein